jgi:prepilin-type N-terminal cleavage/methylation domain-containing protein
MSELEPDARLKVQGSRFKSFTLYLSSERSGRSLSCGNRTAHPLRVSHSKGFTLLELVIVIAIIVTLMGLFMNRFMYYQEQAEKTAMQQVAGAIQSALVMQYGQILTRGKPSDVAALAHDNPMNVLQKKPRNYAGEFYDPTPQAVAPGSWMFDLKTRDLIYVVGEGNYFRPGKDGRKWIRFHVALSYTKSLLPSLHDEPAELTGLLFEPVEPYTWF